MKKLATVEIYEMEPQERQGVGGVTDHGGIPDAAYWRIRLASRVNHKPEEAANPSILAHELGHVVAHIFELPGATVDDLSSHLAEVLFGSQQAVGQFKDAMRLKLEAEKEAWGIAHEEGVPIDPASEAFAIGSYEQAVEDAEY